MKYRICSDIHGEFFKDNSDAKFNRIVRNIIPTTEDDKNNILLLAGDIGTYSTWDTTYRRIISYLSPKFKYVILTAGNHSWYGCDFWGDEYNKLWNGAVIPKNVFYLKNEAMVLEENKTVVFGGCMWTSLGSDNPMAKMYVNGRMNDYSIIKRNRNENDDVPLYKSTSHKVAITPDDTISEFYKFKTKFESALDEFKNYENFIVLTHHAPSNESIDMRYRGSDLNVAYVEDMTKYMFDYPNIKLWTHGHMHSTNQYKVSNCDIVVNAYGYHSYEENLKYDKNMSIEI